MYTATCHTRLGAFTSKSISVLCGVSDHLDLTVNLSQLELPGCTFGLHWPYLRHNKIKGSEKERQRERESEQKQQQTGTGRESGAQQTGGRKEKLLYTNALDTSILSAFVHPVHPETKPLALECKCVGIAVSCIR